MENSPPPTSSLPSLCGKGAKSSAAGRSTVPFGRFFGGTPATGIFAATDLLLPAELAGQIVSLAEITYPFEACGLLIGQQIDATVVVEQITYGRNLESTSFQGVAQPRGFLLDPEDFLAADRVARSAGRDIVGVWHSHPDTPAQPTEREHQSAWAGYSYLMVAVSAAGAAELRSWRLTDERFLEERLR